MLTLAIIPDALPSLCSTQTYIYICLYVLVWNCDRTLTNSTSIQNDALISFSICANMYEWLCVRSPPKLPYGISSTLESRTATMSSAKRLHCLLSSAYKYVLACVYTYAHTWMQKYIFAFNDCCIFSFRSPVRTHAHLLKLPRTILEFVSFVRQFSSATKFYYFTATHSSLVVRIFLCLYITFTPTVCLTFYLSVLFTSALPHSGER